MDLNTRSHAACSRVVLFFFLPLFLALGSSSVFAFQPAPQQVQMLKDLPEHEQRRLAEQFGLSLPQKPSAEDGRGSEPIVSVGPRNAFSGSENEAVGDEKTDQLDSERVMRPELKPFGYDLFAGEPSTFAPIHDVPVSADYSLGVGDSLNINLYGKENNAFELVIDSEGKVYLPELGPLTLVGLSFADAKQKIIETINQKMIGVKALVSMGQLRAIRVFVLGEAYAPGSYIVSSLSTMTNALLLSGGIAESGSLRNVQLKREGKVITTLDLYDLLLRGDTRDDAQLRSGDVVFIPPVERIVSVGGAVRRPAIYEINGGESAGDVVAMAGGLTSDAFAGGVQVTRIGGDDSKTAINLNLNRQGDSFQVQNGDAFFVSKVLERKQGVVSLTGHVLREGDYAWQPGLRVSDVLRNVSYLQDGPDLNYALIKRFPEPQRQLAVVSFAPGKALSAPMSTADPVLQERDEILVFAKHDSDRVDIVEDVLNALRAQASLTQPSQEVTVSGNVQYPGTYPLVPGMTVEDLVYAAGGLTERAFQLHAELSRTVIGAQQMKQQSRFDLDLSEVAALSTDLKSRDTLQIKTIPDWADSQQVTLVGEVRFPGVYPIHKNDTLADVIERAGGLTEFAYIPGAVFTREELKLQQAERLEEMQRRLKQDIAKAELATANATSSNKSKPAEGDIEEAQKLLEKLVSTEATGRLVIDLQKVMADTEDYQIPLQDGDELFVPMRKNSVTIVGEVQLPISQVYEPQLDYEEYINRSGGTTDKADEERIYIVKANGAVEIPDASSWFVADAAQVDPGDTIVVPLDADKIDQVVLWRDLSQIFYQIALGAAAVGSL